jgi:glycosyltransferase involved in cell wall biosynthesis
MSKISILIITYNEEKNLRRCLESVRGIAAEIIVVDSLSSDNTVNIANEFGAKVVSQKFLGYGQQKNLGLSHCQSEWVFSIDADECLTKELEKSILNIVHSSQSQDMYAVKRLTNYCGKWIRHGGWYPDSVPRLFRREKGHWTEPQVHEELVLKSPAEVKLLEGDLHHYSFPTVQSQVERNIKYAKLGAKALLDKKKRRPNLLEIVIRPAFKFFECYVLKLGLLDGREGYIIAVNAAHSMFMKYTFAKYDLPFSKD